MTEKLDERFEVFSSGKSLSDSLDKLKDHWWEKKQKPELEYNIEKAMKTVKGDIEKETLQIMRELIKVAKIRKTGGI